MKKIFLFLILFFACVTTIFSQTPFSFKYQAVARDATEKVLSNQTIGLRISILENSATGIVVYSEIQSPATSNLGVLSINVGTGTVQSGDFSSIDWDLNQYWLKVEMDISGGTNYILMGASQLLSVPYALHANTVTNKDDADADPGNEIQTLSFNANNNALTISGGNTITIPTGGTDADPDPTNELQDLSLNGTTLSIANGNSVNLSVLQDGVDDADANPNNEIQLLTKSGNMVTLSQNGGSFTDEVNDADADPTNELQTLGFNAASNVLSLSDGGSVDLSSLDNDSGGGGTGTDDQILSLSGTVLSIEDGNSVNLDVIQDGVDDADADATNEIQSLALNGTNLQISNSNAVDLTVLQDGVIDADADASNELQNLTLNGTTLVIDNGNSVNLNVLQDGVIDADADPNNELQNLSLQNNTLSISGTNSQVDLSSFGSHWTRVAQTDTLEYKMQNPVARVTDSIKTVNIAKDLISFEDTSRFRSYLTNSSLDYSILHRSPNFIVDENIAGFSIDSIHFKDYDEFFESYSSTSLDNCCLKLRNGIDDFHVSSYHDPYQIEFSVQDYQAWGLMDAYGLEVFAIDNDGFPNDWAMGLRTGMGLFVGEAIGIDSLESTLTNHKGFTIGQAFGLGDFEDVYTHLDKDSLTFNHMVVGGLSTGYSSYGRDRLNMNFQAGPTTVSTNLTPSVLKFTHRVGGTPQELSVLTSKYLSFTDDEGGLTFAHLAADSITMANSDGFLFGDVMKLRANELNFEDQFHQSFFGNTGFTIKEILTPIDIFDRISLLPDAFTMYNDVKWKNVQLGTITGGNAGHLSLWNGTGDFKLAELGRDNLDGLGGSLELFSDNSGVHATAWLRAENKKGSLTLNGPNTLNVYLGHANGGDRGIIGVYDIEGLQSAGMRVTTEDKGIVYADVIYAGGEEPVTPATYPFKTLQTLGYGMSLERHDKSFDWEFYVNAGGHLSLYSNNTNYVGVFDATTGAYTSLSDRKFKEQIRPMDNTLEGVRALKPSKYRYISNNPTQKESIGFIAQEVQKLFPTLVHENVNKEGEEVLTLDYSGFGVIAIKAIQEQQVIIENQAEQLETLEKDVAELKLLVEQLVKSAK